MKIALKSQKCLISAGTVIALIGILLVCSTQSASAYVTIDQKAIHVTDQTAIFTLTYRFIPTVENDFYMPIFAVRDLPHGSKTTSAGYEILENEQLGTQAGTAAGIILSNEEIVDNNMYRVRGGTAGVFTLLVVYTAPESADENNYMLHLNELPFYAGDTRRPREMNVSELAAYVTPEIRLGKNAQ